MPEQPNLEEEVIKNEIKDPEVFLSNKAILDIIRNEIKETKDYLEKMENDEEADTAQDEEIKSDLIIIKANLKEIKEKLKLLFAEIPISGEVSKQSHLSDRLGNFALAINLIKHKNKKCVLALKKETEKFKAYLEKITTEKDLEELKKELTTK